MKYFLSEEFIEKWQTLIGSFLGLFLAVIFSVIGFWIKSAKDNYNVRKEYLRRIEIGITRSLDDTFKVRHKLRQFVARLRELIRDIESITDARHFSLESTNFLPIREIYRDIEAPNLAVKSYYLHNKLLWVDSNIKEINVVIPNLKSEYIELQRRNELLINLVRQNNNPNPSQQRADYSSNLKSFADAIDEFINEFFTPVIKIMVQVKIFNDHLRRKHGSWFLWKHEGTKLKCFRNKLSQEMFSRNLDSLDRIDKVIEVEVGLAIQEAETRAAANFR